METLDFCPDCNGQDLVEEEREGTFQIGTKNPIILKAKAPVIVCKSCGTMLADWRMEEAKSNAYSTYLKDSIDKAKIPEPYYTAHAYSSRHRLQLEHVGRGGCFYCLTFSNYDDIARWIDGDETACCPRCGIDAVLPATEKITPDFLKIMQKHWFATILEQQIPASAWIN